MLINFNGNICINLDNVGRFTIHGQTISFYLNSGESYHVPFKTAEDAEKAFEKILGSNSTINLKKE